MDQCSGECRRSRNVFHFGSGADKKINYRLSRPSLSYQHPLPGEENGIPVKASLSYPSDTSDRQFILNPNVREKKFLYLQGFFLVGS